MRFTDDLVRRVKQFTKGGATRCEFMELPSEMTKVEALNFMLSQPLFASAEDQATIEDSLADREKEARKGEVKVKATKAKPSLDAIKNRAKKSEVSVSDVLKVTQKA